MSKTKKSTQAAESSPDSSVMERAIGHQARLFRQLLNMSMGDVAKAAKVSQGTLSKIEAGAISPSLATLRALAKALNIPVTALFRKYEEEREAIHFRAGQGPIVDRRGTKIGMNYRLLGHPIKRSRVAVEPCMIELQDGFQLGDYSLQHGGVEFIYVTKGVMTYRHGSKLYELGTGDSLFFDGDIVHGPEVVKKAPVNFISVVVQPRFDE